MTLTRRLLRQANFVRVFVVAALSLSLAGCFDLSQSVEIGRDGSGHYAVSIAAAGLVGQALKERPAHIDGLPPPRITTDAATGKIRQTASLTFKSLSDLKLGDELMTLRMIGKPFFGLGPTHYRFRRTFLIGNAQKVQAEEAGRADDAGTQILSSMFGDHTYVFSVTLPGSIISAQPLQFEHVTITPAITGDIWNGHTVTWSMPLYLALSRQMLSFEADFSAYATFGDAQSRPKGT